ncbi:MAG: putative toxin-antitoxin system toxin component, PIN family [Nitrospira sp.]|nr:putative toxin-antitoxin system toxin component, PIN family [Nitrospira sp.]MDH5337772.1 putative toxin-antitoxin system toxin component, PIN family [Nitrospira sp.]
MKVVFDTNVYVSAFLLPGSLAEDAFLRVQRRQATLFTSVPILTETAGVFRTKFQQGEEDVAAVLRLIGRVATIVKPSVRIMVLEDLPDNRILECGVEAGADLIVTGDHHLLRLKTYQDVTIVRVSDFLRLFPEDPTSPFIVKKKKTGRQRRAHMRRRQ